MLNITETYQIYKKVNILRTDSMPYCIPWRKEMKRVKRGLFYCAKCDYWGQAKGFYIESSISFISFDIHSVEIDVYRTQKNIYLFTYPLHLPYLYSFFTYLNFLGRYVFWCSNVSISLNISVSMKFYYKKHAQNKQRQHDNFILNFFCLFKLIWIPKNCFRKGTKMNINDVRPRLNTGFIICNNYNYL